MFGRKSKIIISLLVMGAMLCGITACDNGQLQISADVSENPDESGFNIERVRKNIVIKGQTIEVPTKLGDIQSGWSYELYDEKDVYLTQNQFLATMFYKGEEMYIAALENYEKGKAEESIIYNLTIYDSDCSIDGLVPYLTTKQDVVEKYGEPLPDVSRDNYYYYGLVNGENKLGGRLNDHAIGIRFAEDDTVKGISITYADLSKQY